MPAEALALLGLREARDHHGRLFAHRFLIHQLGDGVLRRQRWTLHRLLRRLRQGTSLVYPPMAGHLYHAGKRIFLVHFGSDDLIWIRWAKVDVISLLSTFFFFSEPIRFINHSCLSWVLA